MCGHPSFHTHVSFGVDFCLGFEQCDGGIGMALESSRHQRRVSKLRTHNDTERQSKCVGIPHLTRTYYTHTTIQPATPTRTLSVWLMSALTLSSVMAISVLPNTAAFSNGVTLCYEHTMILRDSPVCGHPSSRRYYCATLPYLRCAKTSLTCTKTH